jgi:hypothetical protein
MNPTKERGDMFVVEFPNGDSFYACRACKDLVVAHDTGAYAGSVDESRNVSCELHYHGICIDKAQEKVSDDRMSEDWLIQNLPAGWAYDCSMRNPRGMGFIVGPKETLYEEGGALFIPLSLLK